MYKTAPLCGFNPDKIHIIFVCILSENSVFCQPTQKGLKKMEKNKTIYEIALKKNVEKAVGFLFHSSISTGYCDEDGEWQDTMPESDAYRNAEVALIVNELHSISETLKSINENLEKMRGNERILG